ncbi:MAG: flagellar hook-associated protein FlgK [Lachnospiraceae bacterium]|nr:flagellar hook-associated protein FlgK [Lachnospiraceae bacterium]
MPSTFFGLNIAYSGLTASSAALNTTGNNIANVETKGYSRQAVTQQAYDALRTFTTYGCAGAGVDTIAIERIRDEFYDVKYWNNNTTLGEYDIKQYYMEGIENYFVDDEDTAGFTTIFNEMYDALAEVKKNSGDTTTITQFLGFAKNLTDYFNNLAGNLQKVQTDTNSEIKIQVDSMNSLAAQIATLNKQINVIEVSGSTANELRDQRSLLIDKLSSIVDVEVTETPVYDTNNPDRVTGANRYVVTIAGGQTLVDTNEYNTLMCEARSTSEKVNQSDVDGLYDIKWSNGSDFGMYSANLGGTLKGLIAIRDGNNTANFNGSVSAIGTSGTNQTVTIEATADYLKDLNKSTLPENGGVINVGNKLLNFDSWTFDEATNSYTFTLSNSNATQLNANYINREAKVGASINYQGVPYYMQQMNEWIRSFSEAFNEALTQVDSVDGYGNPADILFTGVNGTGTGEYDVSTEGYYNVTALNFTISEAIIADAQKFATHTGASEGSSKYDVIDDLIDLKTNKDEFSFRGSSAGEFLQCILSDVAINASNANTFYLNYTNLSSTIETQRLSVSGVDQDEEALNLVKYQNSYTLASKMIQTLTECYDRLILQTGV